MKSLFFLVIFLVCFNLTMAQNSDLPYRQIPDYPDSYTAANVAARMIDGLGFRYYWATEGLRPEDLAFRPNDEARTSEETIDHILGLSNMILSAVTKQPNSGIKIDELSFEQKRRMTLKMLEEVSTILKGSTDEQMADYKIIFQRSSGTSEMPCWNLINGPIADALWHCGQVVSFRRSSGNPFNDKVSVLSGRVRE